MKTYNKVIEIEISVDSIAKRLLENMKDSPVAENIVEAVIGTALSNGRGLDKIYNAMCGFSNELAYKVGDEIAIHCETENIRNCHPTLSKEYYRAEIIGVDEYEVLPLDVRVTYINSKGATDEMYCSVPLRYVATLDKCVEWDAAFKALEAGQNLFAEK